MIPNVRTNFKKSLEDFRDHHKNKWNLGFHFLCGLIYTSIFLFLLGGMTGAVWPILLYALLLIALVPSWEYLMAIVLIIVLLLFMNWLLMKIKMKMKITTYFPIILMMVIVLFYMAPELSHMMTKEKTVLTWEGLSIVMLWKGIENFLFLFPYTVYSLFL